MEHLDDLWNEHLELIDRYINLNFLSAKSLQEWFAPLIHSITADGAVPYLLNDSERYRASPLSSTIIWLDSENLLPIKILNEMQDMLINLRDNNLPADNAASSKIKKEEDSNGWSLGEGVSVWSTSLAIIALLDGHGNGLKKVAQFKDSVLWLAAQRNINEYGWAYQSWANCAVNPVMTALALRALALTLTGHNKTAFDFTPEEERQICSSIKLGFDYLKKKCHLVNGKAFWCFNNTPHCAATTWALMALHQITLTDDDTSQECLAYYDSILDNALAFVLSEMPNKAQKWPDEQFVYEAGAKYNKQKNYFSYSATLLPQLFSLGLTPYHPKVLNQIKWLVENPEDWKIANYDKNTTCTFTYAMILTVLTSWARRVGCELTPELIAENNKVNKASKILFGFSLLEKHSFQLVTKGRMWWFFVLTVLLVITLLFGHNINAKIQQMSIYVVNIWTGTANDRHSIYINIISTAIYTALVGLFALLAKMLRRWIE